MYQLWRINTWLVVLQLIVAAFPLYAGQWLVAVVVANAIPYFARKQYDGVRPRPIPAAIFSASQKVLLGLGIALLCYLFATGSFWPFGGFELWEFLGYVAMTVLGIASLGIGIISAFHDADLAADDVFYSSGIVEMNRKAIPWVAMPVIGIFVGGAILCTRTFKRGWDSA